MAPESFLEEIANEQPRGRRVRVALAAAVGVLLLTAGVVLGAVLLGGKDAEPTPAPTNEIVCGSAEDDCKPDYIGGGRWVVTPASDEGEPPATPVGDAVPGGAAPVAPAVTITATTRETVAGPETTVAGPETTTTVTAAGPTTEQTVQGRAVVVVETVTPPPSVVTRWLTPTPVVTPVTPSVPALTPPTGPSKTPATPDVEAQR